MQPEVTMTEDEKEAEKILAGSADFEFQLAYEIIPSYRDQGLSPTSRSPARSTTCRTARSRSRSSASPNSTRSYEPKDGKAEEGDRVTIDYVGKIDGVAFEGGAGTDAAAGASAPRSSSPASRTS